MGNIPGPSSGSRKRRWPGRQRLLPMQLATFEINPFCIVQRMPPLLGLATPHPSPETNHCRARACTSPPPPFRGPRGVGGRRSGSGLLPLNISGFEHQQEVARAGRTPTHRAPASATVGTGRFPQTGIESVNHTGDAAATDDAWCPRGCRPHAPRFTFFLLSITT